VIGISPDTAAAQKRFQARERLPFALLADTERQVAAAYGALQEKSMYGRRYLGVARTTVVIGAEGEVRRVYTGVKPAGHAAAVLRELRLERAGGAARAATRDEGQAAPARRTGRPARGRDARRGRG
jgi:peroxiredoxin